MYIENISCTKCECENYSDDDFCEDCYYPLYRDRDKRDYVSKEFADLMDKYRVCIFLDDDTDAINPFVDSYENYVNGYKTNEEYGVMYLKTYSYDEKEDGSKYDDWEPSMEPKFRTASVIGRVKDLGIFLKQYLVNGFFLPGIINGTKFPISQIPDRFTDKYSDSELERFFVKSSDGKELYFNNEEVCRFSEYVLPEALPICDHVDIVSMDGKLITEFKDDSRYGYITVVSDVFWVDNGHLEVEKRHAKIKGKVEHLSNFLAHNAINDTLQGRIIVKEFEESKVPEFIKYDFFDDAIDYEQQVSQFLKIRGEDLVLLSENSERILSFPMFVPSYSTEKDLLVQHKYDENLEEWRQERYDSDNIGGYAYDQDQDYMDSRRYDSSLLDIDYGDAFENDPSNLWNID